MSSSTTVAPQEATLWKEVSDVIEAPGIPVHRSEHFRWHWIAYWLAAVLMIFGSIPMLKSFLHRTIELPLGGIDSPTLTVEAQGCDIMMGTGHKHMVVLDYWTFLGSGSIEQQGDVVTVSANMKEKTSAFSCLVRVLLPEAPSEPHFKSLSVQLTPDPNAVAMKEPSNVAEMMVVTIEDVVVSGDLTVNTTAVAQTHIRRVHASALTLEVGGGSLFINDKGSNSHIADKIEIFADNTMLDIELQNSNIVTAMDAESLKLAALAGVEIVDMAGEHKEADRLAHKLVTGAANAPTVSLGIQAIDSPIYVVASANDGGEDSCPTLKTHFGSDGGPHLTKGGLTALQSVRKWIDKPEVSAFVVNMHFPGPHEPLGTLKLLSSQLYSSSSVVGIAMISGGMLEPEIARLSLPIAHLSGEHWPRGSCDKVGLSAKELKAKGSADALKLGKLALHLADAEVKLETSDRETAAWVWDGPVETHQAFVFDKLPGKNGRPASWRAAEVKGHVNHAFISASCMTLIIGAVLGGALIYFMWFVTRPTLLEVLRSREIFNTASYRLCHTATLNNWSMSTTVVQYPMVGVLMRWKTRPLANTFATAQVTARPWPVGFSKNGAKEFKTVKFVPGKLPTWPKIPDQRCFLLPVSPGSKKEKETKLFSSFDTELNAVGLLQYGEDQAHVVVGQPYQFRITAFDKSGKEVEKSLWSRPMNIPAQRAFTDYPFLLWRGWFGLTPVDNFQLFLGKHCKPLERSPTVKVKLSAMRLAMVNDSDLFGGEFEANEKYGEETVESGKTLFGPKSGKTVRIEVSSEGRHPLFEVTKRLKLPKHEERKDLKSLVQVAPKLAAAADSALSKASFITLDFDEVEVPIAYNRMEFVTIEAVVYTNGVRSDNTAKAVLTWTDFLSLASMRSGARTGLGSLTLRDGLTPAALLTADTDFSNHVFGKPQRASKTEEAFPGVVESVVPGINFIWGEQTTLQWAAPQPPSKWADKTQLYDLVLVAETCKKGNFNFHKAAKSELVVARNFSLDTEKATVTVAPKQPQVEQFSICHLQVRPSGKNRELARSAQFGLMRPLSMQDLELGYASWCVRNSIPMLSVPAHAMSKNYCVETTERTFFACKGYRLPLQFEYADEAGGAKMKDHLPLMKDETSYLITRPEGIHIMRKVQKAGDTGSKGSGKAKSGDKLTTPLLESGQAKADEEVKESLLPSKLTMYMPTNVFWNNNTDWKSDLLLKHALYPEIAQDKWLHRKLADYGIMNPPTDEEHVLEFDDLFRVLLSIFLFYGQTLVMALPAMVLLGLWVWHDVMFSTVADDLRPPATHVRIFLMDFLLSPCWQRWEALDTMPRVVIVTFFFYVCLAIVVVFVSNFFHPLRGSSFLFRTVDSLMAYIWAFVIFAVILATVVLAIWVTLGALVNPQKLLPYAVMVVAVLGLAKSLQGKMGQMKGYVEKILGDKLEMAIHAIMFVFLDDPAGGTTLDAASKASVKVASTVTELISQAEADILKQFMSQSPNTVSKVSAGLQTQITTLRNSSAFSTIQGMAKNKVLATDFVPGDAADKASILAKAQEIANEEAVIEGTATYSAINASQNAADLTPAILTKAVAMQDACSSSGNSTGPVDQEEAMLRQISRQLELRPTTAKMIYGGYSQALNNSRQLGTDRLNNPIQCTAVFSKIRTEQLFRHFAVKPPQAPSSATDKQKPELSNAAKFLQELQNSQLEGMNLLLSTALTKRVAWPTIYRAAGSFTSAGLQRIVARGIDMQLRPLVEGNAKFNLLLHAGELAFANFELLYQSDPLQFFVDAKVIKSKYKRVPATQSVLQAAVDATKAGCMTPDTLIQALKNVCLPECQVQSEDFPGKVYLWYDALLDILRALGWTETEMETQYMQAQWHKVTNGTGLFAYEGEADVIDMIMSLSEGGLWKAAAKSLMWAVGVGGYAACDLARDGLEKAAQQAHAMKQLAPTNLVAVGAHKWPGWLEDIWFTNCKASRTSKSLPGTPSFLAVDRIDDFFEQIVYAPSDATGVKFTALSPNAANEAELVWQHGSDGGVWHFLPAGPRKLRGMWLELALDLFDLADFIPSDLDIFFQALKFQADRTQISSPFLRLDSLTRYLKTEYVKENQWCTFKQFRTLVLSNFQVEIPDAVLENQIFKPCPTDPLDDLKQLRNLDDLGYALYVWMGYGLWPNAVSQCLEVLLPAGPVLNMAKTLLKEEFAKLDPKGLGILQPVEVIGLLKSLCKPGLDLEDIQSFLNNDLGLEVPRAEMRKYYTMMDVDGDGILQAREFILFMYYLTFDFLPEHIVASLGLSTKQIVGLISVLVIIVGMVFALVSLVIGAFAGAGSATASAIHSTANTAMAYVSKLSSDSSIGFEDTMTNLLKTLENMVLTAIVGTLGLSKAAMDRLYKLAHDPELI
eukprot:TRINITY_DN90234_c0_g1_i1.p1 TRINITY_DN90234_c0_g1~~TRINITY_DN90234_c0_g1_i1.p1  ORF type:complete len:2393 (-),score=652.37 TRINITY_DN90234_c0_g1_i1:359-7537(-)